MYVYCCFPTIYDLCLCVEIICTSSLHLKGVTHNFIPKPEMTQIKQNKYMNDADTMIRLLSNDFYNNGEFQDRNTDLFYHLSSICSSNIFTNV